MDKFSMLNPEYLALCKRRRLSATERPKNFIVTKEKVNGRWTSRKIPKFVYYWEYDGSDLVVPRGAFQIIIKFFRRHGLKYKVVNKRKLLGTTNFKFHGKLMKSKGQHLFKKYSAKNGILQAGTGTGKTVMSLYWTAKVQQPTIVIVDTNELLEQWKNRISEYFHINKKDIGHIGGGKEIIKPITVALVQTLRKRPDLLVHFGMCIVDECHIAATESYGTVLNQYYGRYVMGLSATPRRADGKTRVMLWYLGGIHLAIDKTKVKRLPAIGVFVSVPYEGTICFQKAYSTALSEMCHDKDRCQFIVDNIIRQVNVFGINLILSKSSKHLEKMYEMMPHHLKLISKLLIGKVDTKTRQKIVQKAMKNKLKFLFATDKLIGKGFDEELLSVLHITTPIKNPEAIEQFCGRVTRIPASKEIRKLKKKAYIFYYYDYKEQILRGAASAVSHKFRELNIEKRIQRY